MWNCPSLACAVSAAIWPETARVAACASKCVDRTRSVSCRWIRCDEVLPVADSVVMRRMALARRRSEGRRRL